MTIKKNKVILTPKFSIYQAISSTKRLSASYNLLFYFTLSNQELVGTLIGKSVNNRTTILEVFQLPPISNTNNCALITDLSKIIMKSSTLKVTTTNLLGQKLWMDFPQTV